MEKVLPFRSSTKFFQETLSSLPINLAILNEQGVIVAVNDAWRRFGMVSQYEDPNCGVGRNYLKVCQEAIGDQTEDARLHSFATLRQGIVTIVQGKMVCRRLTR